MFENKKIVILGMARSGYEVARLLVKHNNEIIINDMGDTEENQIKAKELESLGIKVILGHHPTDLIQSDVDYLVKNPGIHESHDYVKKCRELNIPVVTEIEVAYHFLPEDVFIVGITGTNGKTTTTSLIYDIISRSTNKVHLAGNIGIPLSAMVSEIKAKDILVIEISSQQLINVDKFKTNIGILTNLSEAHLDAHGTYENYIYTKKKIFAHHTKEDIGIINYDNAHCLELTVDINSTKKYFSTKEKKDAYLASEQIHVGENTYDTKDIKLIGLHNYENIMAALLVCEQLKIDSTIIKEALKEFGGVEHRMEFVRNINGIDFYNDSKSTNNIATITALNSFSKDTILILGGVDRGIPFDDLKEHMGNVLCVYCYGETKDKIKDFCLNNDIECFTEENLDDVVGKAFTYSEDEKIILFSPACASWDQYKNFEVRGEHFKEIVNNLSN